MNNLYNYYKDGNLILFVGAGISKIFELPSWYELIKNLAIELNFDPEVFFTYGDFRELAEYYKLESDDKAYKKLKSKLKAIWNLNSIDISSSKIHKLIANGNYNIIYTTNYDNLLEKSLDYYGFKKQYNVIANVKDLKKKPKSREIIKFHGDLNTTSNLILGESSYFKRLDLEDPLDIKFRSDILGKSILFIGYSISDINIRYFLYKLTNTWKEHGKPSRNCASYVFSNTPNHIQQKILKTWNVNMISPDPPSEYRTPTLCS